MGYHTSKGAIAAHHYPAHLDGGSLPAELIEALYADLDVYVDSDFRVAVRVRGREWLLSLDNAETCEYLLRLDQERLEVYLSGAFPSVGAVLYAPFCVSPRPAATAGRRTPQPTRLRVCRSASESR